MKEVTLNDLFSEEVIAKDLVARINHTIFNYSHETGQNGFYLGPILASEVIQLFRQLFVRGALFKNPEREAVFFDICEKTISKYKKIAIEMENQTGIGRKAVMTNGGDEDMH